MLNFEDPTIRIASKAVIVTVAAGLLLIAILGVALTVDWYLWQGQGAVGEGNESIATIVSMLPALSGQKVNELLNTFAIIGISLPLLLGRVCFETKEAANSEQANKINVLSSFGTSILILLILCFVLSLVPYFAIEADVWGQGHRIEAGGVAKFQEWVKTVMRSSVMYSAALLGVVISKGDQ